MNEKSEITFNDYIDVFKKNKIVCLLIFVITVVAIAFYGNVIKQKTYESTGKITVSFVNSSEVSEQEYSLLTSELNDIDSLVLSDDVLKQISDETGYDSNEIEAAVSVSHSTNSFVISIKASDTTANRAYKLAAATLDVLDDELSNDTVTATITNKAKKPDGPASPQLRIYYTVSVALGLLLACLYVVIKVNF